MFKKALMLFLVLFFFGLPFVFAGAQAEEDVEAKEKTMTAGAPSQYGEAPMLAKRVKAGELPPVDERLPVPEDVDVVQVYDRIGDYGGTFYSATMRPDSLGEDFLMMNAFLTWTTPSRDRSKEVPLLAKEIEVSDDYTMYTIHLREGHKWSDGEPFTTEDIIFWHEHLNLNKEYTKNVNRNLKNSDGTIAEIKAIDGYTFYIKFKEPHPTFVRNTYIHKIQYVPAHFLKKYHPDFISKDRLDELLNSGEYDTWVDMLDDKTGGVDAQVVKPGRPTLRAYICESLTSSRRTWVRNPYYYRVDNEGNQLPYIDKVDTVILNDREVLNGKIMSGDVDFAGLNTDIKNYPLYKKFEDQGGYKTVLWNTGMGSDVIYEFNMTDKDPVYRKIFQDLRFRKAMSLAINREEISEVVYFGEATPRAYTVLETSMFFEPEFATAYTDYDPEQANALLDEMGLKWNDDKTVRLRPDGKPMKFTIEFVPIETPKTAVTELVVKHWQEVGMDVDYKTYDIQLAFQRVPSNEVTAYCFHGDKASDRKAPSHFVFPAQTSWSKSIFPLWNNYYNTGGKGGEKPNPATDPEAKYVLQVREWYEKYTTEPDLEKQIEYGKRIYQNQAERLWVIGTVGKTPYALIFDEDLRNIPDDERLGWKQGWTYPCDPEQWFFEGGENKNEQ